MGLIVTEVTAVEPTYIYLSGDMSICDYSYIPGWQKLASAVHQYGTKLLPLLFHPAYMALPVPGTPRLIAPSNVGPYYAKEAPRAVTKEELIANGKTDICMIGRANLCDPEFVSKAQAGREEDIRPCIGCLRCLNGIMFGKRVSCTVNPSLEPENEDSLAPAEVKATPYNLPAKLE